MEKAQSEPVSAPVAFFIFNRPKPTRRVFETIRRLRPPKFLVIADGAREDRPGEAALCREARAIVEAVDWPCELRTCFSDRNLGCKRRLATGLDWVFSQVEAAIILEDDTLPDPSFFTFCGELLERYRDDERVHMIRGSNFLFDDNMVPWSYYFSRFYNIWGWASWARAWRYYDMEMRRWPRLRETDWLERQLPRADMAPLVRYFFDETHAGRIDTWDYQWMLAGWLNDAVAVTPARNLVRNIGFGADATHTLRGDHRFEKMEVAPMDFPLQHPDKLQVHDRADLLEWDNIYPQTSRRSLKQRLGKRLNRLLQ